MQFKSMDSWKIQIKKQALAQNRDITDMQQRFILEEFASKISHSEHKDNFVLKGGFVVSNLLGIDWRTTRDIDMTFKSTIYSKDEIKKILQDVISVADDSFFQYKIINIKEGQVDDGYSGFTVTINAIHGKTSFPLKLDISNNTIIYPKAIESSFKSIFNDKEIQVLSYSIENIIAEKFETTLDRGEYNTRMRDLFDIALLMKSQKHLIDNALLAECIIQVSKERNTLDNLNNFDEIISELKSSDIFNKNFNAYKSQKYAEIALTLKDIFNIFSTIQDNIKKYLKSEKKQSLEKKLQIAKTQIKENPCKEKNQYNNELEL